MVDLRFIKHLLLFLLVGLTMLACNPTNTPQSGNIRVEVIDGNVRRTYVHNRPISVGEFLTEIETPLNDLDRVEPRPFTQITDGMVISIVRVSEEITCYEEDLPFTVRRIPADSLDSGVEEILQTGAN